MMMMLVWRMMLRRKTDPKTGTHTLCEPAQSKCTRTFHKSHSVDIDRKSAVRQSRDTRFVRACAVEIHMDVSQEPCVWKLLGKTPNAPDTTSMEHRAVTVTVIRQRCCGPDLGGSICDETGEKTSAHF